MSPRGTSPVASLTDARTTLEERAARAERLDLRSKPTTRAKEDHETMKKFLIALTGAAMLLAACGSDESNTLPTETVPAETVPADAAVVTTAAAAAPTTEAPATADNAAAVPQRIVSLSPTGTEMLFAIGAGDQVVAVDTFSYDPPEAPVSDLSAFEPNVEAISLFEPDLVVLDFDPGDLVSSLDALGIPSAVVPAATTFDDIWAEIEMLGKVTGNEQGAADLVASMRADIAAAVDAHVGTGDTLTYYHEIDTTLFSLTSQTFAGQIYSLFDLQNIADAEDPDGSAFGYPQLSEEYILEADPDLIFLADVLFEGQSLETLSERPGWDTLSAVQNGNVVELDDDIVSRWGPRVVDYVEAVSEALVSMNATG